MLLPSSFRHLKHLWLWAPQSLQCAWLSTCFVFVSTLMSLCQPHTKTQPSAVRSAVEKQNPIASFTQKTLCDSHVILMKSSTQMGYRFFSSASFEEYQNLLFLFRDLSGIEMKTCSLGISVEIRDVHFFSLKHRRTQVVSMSPNISKVSKNCVEWSNRAANFDLRVLSTCPNSEVWITGGKKSPFYAVVPGVNDDKVFSSCSVFHLGPKQWKMF